VLSLELSHVVQERAEGPKALPYNYKKDTNKSYDFTFNGNVAGKNREKTWYIQIFFVT